MADPAECNNSSLVGFDAMGLTDNENPLGLMPFLMPGLGVGRRRRRDLELPEPEMAPKDVPGGERCAHTSILFTCGEATQVNG